MQTPAGQPPVAGDPVKPRYTTGYSAQVNVQLQHPAERAIGRPIKVRVLDPRSARLRGSRVY